MSVKALCQNVSQFCALSVSQFNQLDPRLLATTVGASDFKDSFWNSLLCGSVYTISLAACAFSEHIFDKKVIPLTEKGGYIGRIRNTIIKTLSYSTGIATACFLARRLPIPTFMSGDKALRVWLVTNLFIIVAKPFLSSIGLKKAKFTFTLHFKDQPRIELALETILALGGLAGHFKESSLLIAGLVGVLNTIYQK
jgi:hypothetical protein